MVDTLMWLIGLVRLAHALLGVLFVAALIGRWVTLTRAERAARTSDLPALQALLGASSVFERLVIQSSIAVFVLGLVTALVEGYPLLGFLQGAGTNWLLVSLLLFLSTLLLVPLVFLPKGRLFGAALEETQRSGGVNPALIRAFGDPIARVAHVYELAVVVVVLALMISKPF
jgi:Predicted integral membrane protein (DUF2269)